MGALCCYCFLIVEQEERSDMKGQNRFLSEELFGGSCGILARRVLKFLPACVGALGSGEAALLTNPSKPRLNFYLLGYEHFASCRHCACPNWWWFLREGIRNVPLLSPSPPSKGHWLQGGQSPEDLSTPEI